MIPVRKSAKAADKTPTRIAGHERDECPPGRQIDLGVGLFYVFMLDFNFRLNFLRGQCALINLRNRVEVDHRARAFEDSGQPVVVRCFDGIELVIVASRTS